MGTREHSGFDNDQQVDLSHLLYTAGPGGPASAFKALSPRKIDAGVTRVINARFNHHKPGPD